MLKYIFKKIVKFYSRLERAWKHYRHVDENANHGTIFYSQEGEDAILKRLFEYQEKGFYVNIGAHHPKRFSNTYYFYKKQWHGINIEPLPTAIELFNKTRPRDINLNMGVSREGGLLNYYIFNEPALNTFSVDLAQEYAALPSFKVLRQIKIPTYSLEEILRKNLPENQLIDFLSIDVEGFDLEVLQSNNWELYRPRIVLVEDLQGQKGDFTQTPTFQFMQSQHYIFKAKTIHTLFFENKYK